MEKEKEKGKEGKFREIKVKRESYVHVWSSIPLIIKNYIVNVCQSGICATG